MSRNKVKLPIKREELDELTKRLEALEKKEREREDQSALSKFIAEVRTYAASKGLCPKCDGNMKVRKRTTVQFEASNRVEHGYQFQLSWIISIGDDKREVLKLVCEDCGESFYMWAKTEKVTE